LDSIHASGVSKRYGGIKALCDASFQARWGEVHALLGENGAGKSTFIEILAGVIRPDAGTISINGERFRASSPREARSFGISACFQDLPLIPDMTVEENIWFRHEPLSRFRTVRSSSMRKATLDLFAEYQFPPLVPGREVRHLSLSERQLVEIGKALALKPSILIFDEATSALGRSETAWLLALAKNLAESGRLVIFISHRLDEIRRIANRVTVFRNGSTVSVYDVPDVDDKTIISDMLGRPLDLLYPERTDAATSTVALKVQNLTLNHRLDDVSLDLHEGEILGVAGLQGHGQRELFHSLSGVNRARACIELWERRLVIRSPRDTLLGRAGVAMVPEDRGTQGLLLSKSVRENLTLSSVDRLTRFGLIVKAREAGLVEAICRSLRIKALSEQLVSFLSGGTQQKVVFGKMLLTEARVLLLYDPTRGIDVGAKAEIFQLMRDLAQKGYAILFYSSDLAELVHVADRVLVFRNGRVGMVLQGERATEDHILRAMIGKDAV